jgi:plastocyanin
VIRHLRVLVSGTLLSVTVVSAVRAQSVLDRPPNISGDWVSAPGTVDFNFLHRFVRSDAPARKISNFPTFNVATSLYRRTLIGFNYATNSTLVAAYPNEWEFFARALPVAQERGAPVDIGAQVGYNLAADGPDGELTVGRRMGPVRLLAVGRVLTNPYKSGAQGAIGGGAVLRLTRHLALAADAVSMTSLNKARGEKVAWGAALQISIPNTPHTLSLQVANTNTATLQGSSRGSTQKRYGFEFTIPITLARYFGHRSPPAAAGPAAPTPSAEAGAGPKVSTAMRGMAFAEPKIEVPAGTTVEWKNEDPLPHTVTADDGSFDSGSIDGGAVWRYTFTKPGTYAFHCTPHPFMKGTVVVR